MASSLEYVILGQEEDEQGDRQRELLLFNGALPALQPEFFVDLVDLAPMRNRDGDACPALVLVDYDGSRCLLASIQPNTDKAGAFIEHFVFIPLDAMAGAASQFEAWLAQLPQASPDVNMTLPLLQPPAFPSVDSGMRAQDLAQLLAALPADGFEHALTLLGALVHKRPLLIRNFPPDFRRRLALVSGIQALLPPALAPHLTFATQLPIACQRQPQLIFGAEIHDESAWIYDWSAPAPIAEALENSYLFTLRALWQGDAAALAAQVQRLASPDISEYSGGGSLAAAVEQVAERFRTDRKARGEDEIQTDVLLRILDSGSPPAAPLRHRYVGKLLQNALNNRDAAAGRRVAEELERDTQLEAMLSGMIDERLEDQPDAVYVFIRNRLIHLGVNDHWLPRLQTAARNSLEVAIEDGDAGTVSGWLELLAHEPAAYALHDVLRAGILAASPRAWGDGQLGIHLILIAVRRVPDIVEQLYADSRLIAALETDVRRALLEATEATLAPLIDDTPEYFLLALYNGIHTAEAPFVSADAARRLWALHSSDEKVNLPAEYRAAAIIRLLAAENPQLLTEEALDLLFRQIVRGDDRSLAADAAHQLAQRDALFPRLSGALEHDSIPIDKALSIMNAVSGIESADPAGLIDTYFHLLDYFRWDAQTQRMMEALARALAKHQEVRVSYRNLWKLFESCHAMQIEGATRVSVLHLLYQYGSEEDMSMVADGVARICRDVHVSKSLREAAQAWWREYAHSCSLPQLQRLERELDRQRHLEAQKQTLKTALAMRRWMHNREPAQFIEAINLAFTFIENITEAFDDAHLPEIDGQIVRREVDVFSQTLSSEQRHILANNLRNLAAKIIAMAENRSKPSLIRSDDSIDQQLMHGEANPHGSVDMMKWIAGYLDGAHPYREE